MVASLLTRAAFSVGRVFYDEHMKQSWNDGTGPARGEGDAAAGANSGTGGAASEGTRDPGAHAAGAQGAASESAQDSPVLAGEVLLSGVDQAVAGLAPASQMDTTRVSGGELREGLKGLAAVRSLTDVATLRLVIEAIERGETVRGGYQLVDWIVRACPGMSRSHAIDLSRIATAAASSSSSDRVAHEPILDAVANGHVAVRRASMILRALARVRPVVNDEVYRTDVDVLLDAAKRRVFTEKDLTRITDRLIAAALPEDDFAERDRTSHALRGVIESSLADGSVIRFIVNAEPEGAAAVRAILASPLAAPTPAEDGTPDPRTPAQRRYDALIATLARGVASPDGQPTTVKAQLMVTMPYDALAAALGEPGKAGADGFGPGFSATGDILSPATIRKLACDAKIIPAVLGSAGELLDLGRDERTITPGQRRALAHRDLHCTFPGCTTPASWCDGHHVVHWARGGASTMANYVLLCPRHHTHVHREDLTATVDPSAAPGQAVTWHLDRIREGFELGAGPPRR